MDVNSLPKTVIRQRRDCEEPGPSAPESSTLTTWLPSHPLATLLATLLMITLYFYRTMLCHGPVSVCPSVRPSVHHKSEFY